MYVQPSEVAAMSLRMLARYLTWMNDYREAAARGA